jgi:hypothetical protein
MRPLPRRHGSGFRDPAELTAPLVQDLRAPDAIDSARKAVDWVCSKVASIEIEKPAMVE